MIDPQKTYPKDLLHLILPMSSLIKEFPIFLSFLIIPDRFQIVFSFSSHCTCPREQKGFHPRFSCVIVIVASHCCSFTPPMFIPMMAVISGLSMFAGRQRHQLRSFSLGLPTRSFSFFLSFPPDRLCLRHHNSLHLHLCLTFQSHSSSQSSP